MKLLPWIKPRLDADLIVVDSIFPQKTPFAFRNSEVNEYIKRLKSFYAVSMESVASDSDLGLDYKLGKTLSDFKTDLEGYAKYYPYNKNHIRHQESISKYNVKLSYSFFVAETYLLLPFYEKHKIPFVFVLYPGGLFGLHSEKSDKMLNRIFQSDQFRAVITTQEITTEYLLSNKLCNKNAIHYIYGGFVQFTKSQVIQRSYYGLDKKELDICFVAAKYSERGVDKGYDMFVDVAKKLHELDAGNVLRFHVIGGFDENDIDVKNLGNSIKFYGYKTPAELLVLYKSMDILLSPNRPNKLYEGNFDGFPLGIDAGYCGVSLFVADELSMNTNYVNGKDIEIINLDSDDIISKIQLYIKNPEELKKLSISCQTKTQDLFDIDKQIDARLKVFAQYAEIKYRKAST